MKRIEKPGQYFVPGKGDIIIQAKIFYPGKMNENFPGNRIMDKRPKTNEMIRNTMPNGVAGMIIRTNNYGKVLDIESSPDPETDRMIGQYLEDLFPEEIAAVHQEHLKKILKTKKSLAYSYELKSGNGKLIQYEVRAVKSHDNEVIFIIRDMTHDKLEKLSLIRGIIEGEEKERKRVAQELHDGLGQIISALYMQVGTLSKKPGMSEYLEGPMKMISDIIREYRAISHNLMPPILEGGGLPGVMKILCERINATGNYKAFLRNTKLKSRPDKRVVLELYRISQELINNAMKHSGCDTIEVELNESNTHVNITISDNGKGFDISDVKKRTDGIGLKNISTRIELIGGTVEFNSVKDKGTTVVLAIPRPVAKNNLLNRNMSIIKA